ncbi:hypothetical protein Moror_13481 [Moniliophthora roreri MCA 2997]|uniref:Uncharacterized protein n=1 Tax=Moniliophthora roreri (strain MCA 2997) TaxID=1381753 RepID=V2WUI9_MONRO|nr:hypothetical protein Moror_13481 [Moniliophthora roreri MCA 2997]
MSSTIPEELMPFLSVRRVILVPLFTLVVMYLVYGFYILLFGTYIYMTCNGNRGDKQANHNLYLTLTVILFVLSTLFVVDYTIQEVRNSVVLFTTIQNGDYQMLMDYSTRDVQKTVVFFFRVLIDVLLNITTNYMLIHRCYLIWSSRKRVAVPLIVVSVIINAIGLVMCVLSTIGTSDSSSDSNWALYLVGNNLAAAYNLGSAIVNSVLTLLTAGRIWWMHRQARAHGAHASDAFVSTIFRIILESGALYPTSMVAALVVSNTPSPFDLASLTALSAGIAPTLVMIRAKLGKNAEGLQTQVSDICFTSQLAPSRETATRPHAQMHSTGNLRIVTLNVEAGSEERLSMRKEMTAV